MSGKTIGLTLNPNREVVVKGQLEFVRVGGATWEYKFQPTFTDPRKEEAPRIEALIHQKLKSICDLLNKFVEDS